MKQRDVPGIDVAYLAMDNETGKDIFENFKIFGLKYSKTREKVGKFDHKSSNLVIFH